ncbi:hypothetical protein [Paraburkholderia metrosideri]|uniref:hypothetical protein n=1 Tax=Paraburkholderia metrosideri TaxID=580937 RepID=UPI001F180B9E|nr:hypothetical protein [Paraburkholderia metrosideri]
MIGVLQSFVLLLQSVQHTQTVVPVRFERVSDEPIGRIDTHISTARELGIIASSGKLVLTLIGGLFDAP